MSLSDLYFRGCFKQLSEQQKQSLEERCLNTNIVDRSCSREDLNTCGKNIQELFDEYQIYSAQKGLYKTWGEIEFPWEISSLTPDLFFELTDDKWAVSTYRQIIAYAEGVRVLLIENDGYELGLYEANQDVLSISGPFDSSKWDKICSIKTTIPVGLPTPEELYERYAEYTLEYFYGKWDEIDSTWSEGTYELALQNCQSQGGTIEDLGKCMRNSNSDIWKDARVRKEFFYKNGDVVRVETECGDAICIWVAIQDIPATEEIYAEYANFKPGPYWKKIYCVNTKANKCLEYQREKEPILGYDVVQIGSLGHYVEVPVPYRLSPDIPTLDKQVEQKPNPTVLTPREILDLDTDIYPYTTECNI